MMYNYKAIIMSLNEDSNKTRFSRECIDKIIQDQPSVPVRINFQDGQIGRTIKFWEYPTNDKIQCEIELNTPNLEHLNLFVVPGGIVHINDIKRGENGETIITKMELTELSITSFPADVSLTRMESIQ